MSMLLFSDAGVDWNVETLNSVVRQATTYTVLAGTFLVSTFMAVKFAWEYFRMSTQGADMNWDWSELIRVLFLLVILGSYVPLSSGVVGAIRGINEITSINSSMHDELAKEANKYYVKRVKVQHIDKFNKINTMIEEETNPERKAAMIKYKQGFIKGVSSDTKKTDGTPLGGLTAEGAMEEGRKNLSGENGFGDAASGWIAGFVNDLTHMIAMIIKWVIGTFIKVVFQIGIVFGPLVLGFGVIFKDKPIQFLNQMLTLGLVFTTLNVLDMLFFSFMKHSMVNPSVGQAIAFDLAMIGAYLSAFKLTTLFVGSTGINSIMGRGLGAAAAGAAVVMGGVAMAAGGAGGGGGGAAGGGGGSSMASIARGVSSTVKGASKERLD